MKDSREIKDWLRKAEKEMNTARANLEIGEYDAAAFYSHQAAEKALKALFILKFHRLWKTHDLVALSEKLGAPEEISKLCETLNERLYKDKVSDGRRI